MAFVILVHSTFVFEKSKKKDGNSVLWFLDAKKANGLKKKCLMVGLPAAMEERLQNFTPTYTIWTMDVQMGNEWSS